MLRKLAVLLLCSLAVAGWAAAAKPDANVPVTIMTQNLDDGTDQTYIIAALSIPDFPLSLPDAVDLTYQELQFSAFELRAGVMAAEIATKNPEIVALQEAALWRTGPTPETATTVLFDQLDLLVSALRTAGVPYEIVAVNQLSDLALQGNRIGGALRFTDRNAVLIRSDLRPPQFHLSDVHARTFDAALPFAGLKVTAGWISADVHMGNKKFRFVTTHLESPIPGEGREASIAVQMAQAQQLIHELRNLTIPVVICGDFNSDANGLGPVDKTPTAGLIDAAGYKDVWPIVNGGVPGLTWPYYLEDQFPLEGQFPPEFFATSVPYLPGFPFERIDLFFSKGMNPFSAELVIIPFAGSPVPPYASDHAGVIATFKP